MSDKTAHIKSYNAADIQRYLSGQMPAAEMHALEKAALEDPFLADALEGVEAAVQQHGEEAVYTPLQQTYATLAQRAATTPARVRPVRWWSVAAAAAVLVAGCLIAYRLTLPSQTATQKVVRREAITLSPGTTNVTPVIADSTAASLTTTDTVAANSTARTFKQLPANPLRQLTTEDQQTPTAGAAEVATTPLLKQEQDNKASTVNNDLVAAAIKDKTVAAPPLTAPQKTYSDTPHFTEPVVTEVVQVSPEDLKRKGSLTPAVRYSFNNNNRQNMIRGRVTDPFNNPVSNASLEVENNKITLLTDEQGNFKIPVSDSVVEVAVAKAGYYTQNFRLQQNNVALNQLQLQPAPIALNEVVIEYGTNKRSTRSKKSTSTVLVQNAQPTTGWVAYEAYLQQNKKLPAGATAITGESVVSFVVSRQGVLSDFTIEKSLGAAYDAESIRLIKEGPAWKLSKGRKARVTVIIRF